MGRTKVLGVKKICEVCGKEFEPYLKSTQKFCSHKCYGKSLKGPRVKKNCEVCGVEFEVALSSTQRFCSHKCYYKSDDRRQTFSDVSKKWHQDPEFARMTRERGRESITNYNKSEKGRSTSSKNMREKVIKFNQDPGFIVKRDKAAIKTITRLNQDPEFRAKCDKATSESMLKRLEDPEYIEMNRERARKTMTRMNQDPEFIAKRNKASIETLTRLSQDPEFIKKRDMAFREGMIRRMMRGDYASAQKVLFDHLPKLDPLLNDQLTIEKSIYLTEDIVSRYPGSNKCHYRIDIAYVINNQTRLAIEVDGFTGHCTDEELKRDKVRDSILLNEFGIETIRVRNKSIYKDVDKVAMSIIQEINKLNSQTNLSASSN